MTNTEFREYLSRPEPPQTIRTHDTITVDGTVYEWVHHRMRTSTGQFAYSTGVEEHELLEQRARFIHTLEKRARTCGEENEQ